MDWSNEHQLPISIRKCSCIVLGNIDTSDVHYSVNDQPVNTVSEVRDLGVIFDSSLKFNSHISGIVAKANSRAPLIHKCFVSRNPEILLRAFKVYLRPLLEYATCVWSPHCNYAIDNIEAVQRKFAKRLKGCEDIEYPARLSYLHLQSLERRRLSADLILTYRIIFGLVDVCMSDYFQLMSSNGDGTVTRGNPFKLSVN